MIKVIIMKRMRNSIITSLIALLIVFSLADTAAVGTPTPISPVNGSIGVSCTPTLQWTGVTLAISYDVNVSTSSTFATLVVEKNVTTTSYTVSPSLQASTKYYWRVRANAVEGGAGPWSSVSFFTTTSTCGGGGALPAPTLISPANNTTWTQNLYPTFQWQTVTGASSYTIQISRSTDFSTSYLVKQATAYNTYYIIDTALANCTSYYWRVRGESSSSGTWSSVWKFTLQVPPSQPVPTTPASGAVVTVRRPTFTWESSTGATAYTIEIDGATYSATSNTFTPYSDLSLGSHNWRVRATSCGGGQASDWSQQRNFTIDLNDVILSKPPSGSTLSTATPTFEWYPVDGATKYKLEVKKETIDGQKLFEVEVSGTTFTPTAILNPGTYAWHVMSYRNNAWTGSWSSQPFTFIIQTGEGLTAPSLTAPPNGTTVDFPLTLRWGAVSGAYSYTVAYSKDSEFASATSVTLFGTEYVISSTLEEGRWYWHVRANTSQGGNGPWSSTWTFEVGLPVPQLISPANGTSQSVSAVNFDWSDVTSSQIGGQLYDLDHYELQYSVSNAFESQNTITISDVGGQPLRDSQYGPVNLGDGTYYWRVKAIYIKYPEGTLREGSWSVVFSLSLSTGGTNIPTLVSPISGSVMRGSSVNMVWTAVETSGITGYVLVYMMGTSTNPGNPSQWTMGSYTEIIIPGQSTSSYTISLQENTVQKPYYWWSIATVNTSGKKGAFPSPINFSIDNTPPNIAVVELVQPIDTTLSTRIPTFTWRIPLDNYQGIASWTLEYASDIQLQQNRRTVTGLTNLSTIISGTYASISYTLPSSQALANGTWYWHVSATDAAGNVSAYTQVKSFVVNAGEEAAVKASLVSPPNGFENSPSRPTFSWLPVQGATQYRLQVDNNNNFSSPEIDQDGISTTSYMAPSDLEPDTYYWRVNSNAPNSQWSDVWSLTISGEAPTQVVLVTPASGAQDIQPTPTFQWEAFEGATSYTLQVSKSSSFSGFVVNKTGLTTTSWGTASDWQSNDPTQLEDGTYYWKVSSNVADSTSAVWNFTVKKQTPGGTISITVTVTNINDDPVAGATVTLKKDGTQAGTATTDATGRAVISELDSGTYTLEVTAPGYNSFSETLSLSTAVTRDVKLYRGAVIHGYVYYDNTQNPATNVAVRIYEADTQLQVVSDITDTAGYFSVDNIATNKTYYIVVENYEDQKKQGIVPVQTPTAANALTIIIKTEGEIIGVVQDEGGSPLPGAKVTLRDAQGQFVNSTSTSNIGAFSFKVTPSRYYVEVTLLGYEDYKGEIFTVEYKEVEDLGLITLLSKTGTLVVNIQSEAGKPLDAVVTVKDAAGNVVSTITVAGGTATADVAVGIFSLTAEAQGYQPQVASNISIESGTTVTQDFVLSPSPGAIRLVVIDEEENPLPGAEAFLDGESVGTTDDAGTLLISDITPGDHAIVVKLAGYTDFEEMRTIGAGEIVDLELTMNKSGPSLLYVAVGAVVIAVVVGAWYFMKKGGGEPGREKRSLKKEKPGIPTGVRREGLPRRSYRGR